MAITVKGINQDTSVTGVTTGNEIIWEVDPNETVAIQGINTSAGTARVKTHLGSATPTDFTGFASSAVGDHTATFTEIALGKGVRWIGLEVDSGTWSIELVSSKD